MGEGSMIEKFTRMDGRLYEYLLTHQPAEHEQLRALRERTQQLADARMQITAEQGHLLVLLARLIGARRTLEIGVFTGYSALAVALALPADGRVVACDVSDEWASIGQTFWQRAGVARKVELRIGFALDTLADLEHELGTDQFDLAFIDADKTGYDAYYERSLRLVRQNGLIILDNMLRRGRVADPGEGDADTTALRKLNAKIAGDDRVDSVLLPIGTGMTLVRRR
jgi:O-methyltransferase